MTNTNRQSIQRSSPASKHATPIKAAQPWLGIENEIGMALKHAKRVTQHRQKVKADAEMVLRNMINISL